MKAPNLPSFSDKMTVAAGRAGARIGAVLLCRENMRAEQLVEAVEHLQSCADPWCRRARSRNPPEIAQHLFPVDLVIGDAVELFLEIGGEIIVDIAGEEAFEKGGDEAALVFRNQPLLVEPHIVAVAQDRERRGIGRRPADAELFHPLDERRLGEARRRLGEMLGRLDLASW